MCGQLSNRSPHRSQWDICLQITSLMLGIKMQKTNTILKVQHDFKQCAHILQKIGRSHLHNHLEQNSFVKTYTPYIKGHGKKTR